MQICSYNEWKLVYIGKKGCLKNWKKMRLPESLKKEEYPNKIYKIKLKFRQMKVKQIENEVPFYFDLEINRRHWKSTLSKNIEKKWI